MPRPLKVFTTDMPAWLRSEHRELLGERDHIRQCRILVAAPNGRAAKELAEARKLSSRGERFRLASGNDMDALIRAGFLRGPALTAFVLPLDRTDGARVLMVDEKGVGYVAGTLESGAGYQLTFIPED